MEVHGQDSGVYTCQAKTAFDHATDNLILTVEGQLFTQTTARVTVFRWWEKEEWTVEQYTYI